MVKTEAMDMFLPFFKSKHRLSNITIALGLFCIHRLVLAIKEALHRRLNSVSNDQGFVIAGSTMVSRIPRGT